MVVFRHDSQWISWHNLIHVVLMVVWLDINLRGANLLYFPRYLLNIITSEWFFLALSPFQLKEACTLLFCFA